MDDFKCDYYTDNANSGTSEVIDYSVSDSVVKMKFVLNDGFLSPYVGIIINPLEKEYVDLSKYNQINISIRGENIDRVGVALYVPPVDCAQIYKNDEAIYHSYLDISDEKASYKIDINTLQFPEWWVDLHKVSVANENKKGHLRQVLHIDINSAYVLNVQSEKILELYSFTISRNNNKLFLISTAIYVLLIIGLCSILLILSPKSESEEITIAYKPVNVEESVSVKEKCIEYINNHYVDSDLSLKVIANETAISARRITGIIHEKFACNFKTYLNRLRINESKRLLNETDLNIGEVAFKTGFNSQSHFNRVFKAEVEMSPSEFRSKKVYRS